MSRALKHAPPINGAPSVVPFTKREVRLRALPQGDLRIDPATLGQPTFSRRPPSQDLYRTRYGRSLNLDVIETALRQADYGSMRGLTDLSRETIDTDPHLAAVLAKRFRSISTIPWDVMPAEGAGVDINRSRFYAEVVRNQLNQLPDFGQRIVQLAWGIFDGRAALENEWTTTLATPGVPQQISPEFGAVSWMIKDLGWIHPRRLHFGPEREVRIYDDMSFGDFSAKGIALRDFPAKFTFWTPQLFGDYPEREGLARRVLYWSFFKRFGARERMILLELYGKPWRWLEVEEKSSADRDDLAKADEMLQNIGGDTSFRFPRGTKFNVTQPGHDAGEIHRQTIKDSDEQISKLVLGQTGTTDGVASGMNNNQASVMQDEQFMILLSDARMISEVIETCLTDYIIALNFGAEALNHAPHFRLRADVPLDRSKEIERLQKAVNTGLEIALSEAYEVAGFRQPKADEAVIKMETPPTHPLAVQPPPERPIAVYPEGADLPARQVQPIAPPPEGLQQPRPDMMTPEQAQQAVETMPSTMNAHPADVALVKSILCHGSACMCKECNGGRVNLEGDDEGPVLQPEEAVIGSLETLIAKGTKEGARELGNIAEAYAAATEGLTDAGEISRALDRVHESVEMAAFARSLERRIIHGAMSGAIASQYEVETDSYLEVATLERKVTLAGEGEEPPADPNFVERPLQNAVTWFREKQVVSKTIFNRLDAAAKRRAFTMAGATNDLILQKAKDALEGLIREGGQLRTFRKVVSERFENAGFTPVNASHVETIYRTNVLNAYNSGRHAHATQPAILRARPYWQIRTVNDGPPRQRHTHQAVHMWVLSASDSFWKRAYPPFGFNCRCRVVTMSKVELDARSLRVRSGGEVAGLPDPGFTSGYSTLL